MPVSVAQLEKYPSEPGDQPTGLTPLNIIRTETVLSKFPVHNLAKKGRVNIQITKLNEHGGIDLRWEVSHSDRYGQARQLAYKLDTVIINRRIDELGRPLPKIIKIGSLRETCKELGLSVSGHAANDLKNSFLQNAFTGITAKLKYKSKDGTERHLEAGFTRYSVIFTGERLPDGTKADAVYIVLNDPYWEVLNNAPVRPLDYEYIKALPPASQRFYEIISYRVFTAIKYNHPHAKLLYSDYCTFSAQKRYFDRQHVQIQMHQVHKPHIQSSYIEKVRYEPTSDSDDRSDWMMYYIPGARAFSEYTNFNRKRLLDSSTIDTEAEPVPQGRRQLEAEGPTIKDLTSAQAEELVKHFYKRFHNIEKSYSSSKEFGQALTLINQHGFEKAKHIVDFSHHMAQETNFNPQTFGGILQYVERGAADYDRRHREQEMIQRHQAEEAKRRRQEQESYRRADEALNQLPQEEYQRLYNQKKAEWLELPWANKWSQEALDRNIQMSMIQFLRDRGAPPTDTLS